MRYNILIILAFLACHPVFAQETVILSEELIKTLINKKPPSVQEIETSFLEAKEKENSLIDQFSYHLEGEASYYESKETLLNDFDGGVTANANTYSIGVIKPTIYGFNFRFQTFAQKNSNAFIDNAATAGITLGLSMNLYQDFLGRKSKNRLQQLKANTQRAELEKNIQLKTFQSNIRKIYWSLVANNEQKNLLTSLVQSAKKQYDDILNRQKSGVSDTGEVARYRSQWTTRKADLLSLNYKEAQLKMSLKQFLPDLNGKIVQLNKYNVSKTIQEVFMCTSKIAKSIKPPLQNTLYDDIIKLLQKERKFESKVINTYDDPQVLLTGDFSNVGRDFGISNAQSSLSNNPKSRTSLGLKVIIPIGSRKKETRNTQYMISKNKYESQMSKKLSQLSAFHYETLRMIRTLMDVVKNQKETNIYFSKSLTLSEKKYKQARISLQELISEQDLHLQSNLKEIDSQLVIIHTLLDYFSVYTETPCQLNRI